MFPKSTAFTFVVARHWRWRRRAGWMSLVWVVPQARKDMQAATWCPPFFLRRRRGRQGPRHKCGALREELWDWFVDIRGSVSGRIPPSFVMTVARNMATEIVAQMRRKGTFVPLPVIDRRWLNRWQRDYGVCFRKPNKRFKCSWKTLGKRCKAMWRNVFFVRALAQELFGHDLPIFGLDQTPLHMNEAGSRKESSLEIQGAPSISLLENHAATRERVSVLTCVF